MTATMDFFGHQEQARRATRRLIVLFALAVLGIIAAIYVVAAAIFVTQDARGGFWQPGLLGIVALGVGAVVGLAMLWRTSQLRQGGPAVASMLGGRAVDHDTRDHGEKQLLNVVEEMAIASGVPVPRVFVLDGEPGLNAFAAGWGTRDAAVAVTRGLLDATDRDELQGVIAHEFSHVFHGDMRLNIRLMGVLFGIVCIATIGELIVRTVGRTGVRSSSSNKKGGGGAHIVIFGIALIAIGWIGVFFANLIKAAVSRQREFLADASAVAYTRNPRGIGLALARIGGLGSRIENGHAREASHMFFADGVKNWLGTLGATHPPIEQRIERVLPGFLRELRQQGARASGGAAAAMYAAAQHTPAPAVAGFAAGVGAGAPGAGAGAAAGATAAAAPARGARATGSARGVDPATVPGMVGELQPEFVLRARELLAALPLDVLGAARDPQRVRALLYALLLGDGDRAQLEFLQQRSPELAHEARVLATELRRLDATVRLPLLELMVPALRRLPGTAIEALHADAHALAHADDRLTTFEFALLKAMQRYVPPPGRTAQPKGRPIQLAAVPREVELVLSVIAHAGAAGAADARAAGDAFAQGAMRFVGMPPLALRPAAECDLRRLDDALDRLARLSPLAKKMLLTACAHAAGADGRIEPAEGELLRAFADLWECPMPPIWAPTAQPGARPDAEAAV